MQTYEQIAYIPDKAKINEKIIRHEIPEGFYRKWTINITGDEPLEIAIQVKRLRNEGPMCQCIVFDDETPIASTEPKPFVPDEINICHKDKNYSVAIVDPFRTMHEIRKRAVEIEYETDEETRKQLPKEIDVPMYGMNKAEIRNYIINVTKYYPKSFKIKEPPVHPPKTNV